MEIRQLKSCLLFNWNNKVLQPFLAWQIPNCMCTVLDWPFHTVSAFVSTYRVTDTASCPHSPCLCSFDTGWNKMECRWRDQERDRAFWMTFCTSDKWLPTEAFRQKWTWRLCVTSTSLCCGVVHMVRRFGVAEWTSRPEVVTKVRCEVGLTCIEETRGHPIEGRYIIS